VIPLDSTIMERSERSRVDGGRTRKSRKEMNEIKKAIIVID
jgi:hypothetical protein